MAVSVFNEAEIPYAEVLREKRPGRRWRRFVGRMSLFEGELLYGCTALCTSAMAESAMRSLSSA
jgi:hypothetical protein